MIETVNMKVRSKACYAENNISSFMKKKKINTVSTLKLGSV